MTFGDVFPLLCIVAFWALIFIFAFAFSRRAMSAPRAADHEAEERIEHEGSAESQDAPVSVNDQVPSKPSH